MGRKSAHPCARSKSHVPLYNFVTDPISPGGAKGREPRKTRSIEDEWGSRVPLLAAKRPPTHIEEKTKQYWPRYSSQTGSTCVLSLVAWSARFAIFRMRIHGLRSERSRAVGRASPAREQHLLRSRSGDLSFFKVILSCPGKILVTLVQRKPLLPVPFCQCSQAFWILPVTSSPQIFLRVGVVQSRMSVIPGSVRSIPMPAGCGRMSERSSMWVVCVDVQLICARLRCRKYSTARAPRY